MSVAHLEVTSPDCSKNQTVNSVFLLQCLFMYGVATTQSLLVLFCTNQLHFSDQAAYALYADYAALMFGLPIWGGYLGERFLNHYFSLLISVAFCAAGLFTLAFCTSAQTLYLGLALFLVGNALLVPNIHVLLGRSLGRFDKSRDSGFTISYIGMNVGALLSMATSGLIAQSIGYRYAFELAALICLAMFVILFLSHRVLQSNHQRSASDKLLGTTWSLVSVPVIFIILTYASLTNHLLLVLFSAVLVRCMYLCSTLPKKQRSRLLAFLILVVMAISFWSLYMLAPSVLTLFAERNVDRTFAGITIPAASLISLNPLVIILVGPLLSLLWLKLGKRRRLPSTPYKFTVAITLMGLGYFSLAIGITQADKSGLMGLSWFVVNYALQSTGELFIGPIGFSMVGKLVPSRYESFMMGVWHMGLGFSAAVSSWLGGLTVSNYLSHQATQTNPIYLTAFSEFAGGTLLLALLSLILAPRIKQLIN